MMNYRVIKNALQILLGAQAESRFRVVGYQGQSHGADELTGGNKLVQVYFSEGTFPKSSGRKMGEKDHHITIEIDMQASAKAEVNTAILTSESSTAEQKAAALLALRTASDKADESLDDLIDAVWNIVMDARNEQLGLDGFDISNRWIDRIQKDTVLENGDLVTKTASMKYTCRVIEEPLGDIGNQPDPAVYDSTIQFDDTGGAGSLTENDI